MRHSFWIHSFTVGHLGGFQYLAVVNCAAINIVGYRFFWIGVSGLLGYNSSSGIAGSKGSSIYSSLKKFYTVFHSGCTSSIPTNSALRLPFLHNLSNNCLLICLWWPFWQVWSGISLWISFSCLLWVVMLSLFSYVSGPSVCFPWRSVCSTPFPIF